MQFHLHNIVFFAPTLHYVSRLQVQQQLLETLFIYAAIYTNANANYIIDFL